MQLLFDRSFEYGEHAGLGLIPGEVADLRGDLTDPALKVPHMGWNSLHIVKDDPLFKYFQGRRIRLLCPQLFTPEIARTARWEPPNTAMWR